MIAKIKALRDKYSNNIKWACGTLDDDMYRNGKLSAYLDLKQELDKMLEIKTMEDLGWVRVTKKEYKILSEIDFEDIETYEFMLEDMWYCYKKDLINKNEDYALIKITGQGYQIQDLGNLHYHTNELHQAIMLKMEELK